LNVGSIVGSWVGLNVGGSDGSRVGIASDAAHR